MKKNFKLKVSTYKKFKKELIYEKKIKFKNKKNYKSKNYTWLCSFYKGNVLLQY